MLVLAAALAVAASGAEAQKPKPDKESVDRGRYLAIVGGCNDCHSAGYAESEGVLPERYWLLGSALGFRGFWGTTYATNLRRSLARISETEWVRYARNLETRPPMPWYNLSQWDEDDLRAFYRYVRQLGPVGKPEPHPVPPHEEPKTAVIEWPIPVAPGSAFGPGKPKPTK